MSEEYKAYLRSPGWQYRRSMALVRAKGQCERCGEAEWLDVHHKTYKNVGRERPSDIEAICRKCHDYAHREIDKELQHRVDTAKELIQAWVKAMREMGERATRRECKRCVTMLIPTELFEVAAAQLENDAAQAEASE